LRREIENLLVRVSSDRLACSTTKRVGIVSFSLKLRESEERIEDRSVGPAAAVASFFFFFLLYRRRYHPQAGQMESKLNPRVIQKLILIFISF
jgi:hypothetical protein